MDLLYTYRHFYVGSSKKVPACFRKGKAKQEPLKKIVLITI